MAVQIPKSGGVLEQDMHGNDLNEAKSDIRTITGLLRDVQDEIASLNDKIATQKREIDRLTDIVVGVSSGDVTIRSARSVTIAGGGSTLAVAERITAKTGTFEIYANVLDSWPQAGKANQTVNFMGAQTTLKFNQCFMRADATMEINAVGSFKLRTTGKATFATGDIRVDATKITVNCPVTEFVRGLVRGDTFVANTMIAASYTPGAGNIW